MTPTQKAAQHEYRAYVTNWLENFAKAAGIPLAVLRAGGYVSRRVRPIRAECAYRLHSELGLSASQIGAALNASDRHLAARWITRGREQQSSRPPGVPDSRQPALPLVA